MSEQDVVRKASVTKQAEREVRIERIFEAPRERVFAAFVEPRLIAQWWRPAGEDRVTVVDELEARPGGRWQFVIGDCDGSKQVFRGVFREVTAPERLVWTFEWDGMPGHVSIDSTTFEDLGERTRVVTTSYFHLPEERDGMLGSGMEKGLGETYARLDELLAGQAAG